MEIINASLLLENDDIPFAVSDIYKFGNYCVVIGDGIAFCNVTESNINVIDYYYNYENFGYCRHICFDGRYYYASFSKYGVCAFEFNGSSLIFKKQLIYQSEYYSEPLGASWADTDNKYIYVPSIIPSVQMAVFTFNGNDFILKGELSEYGWNQSRFLYCSNGSVVLTIDSSDSAYTTIMKLIKFDGVQFNTLFEEDFYSYPTYELKNFGEYFVIKRADSHVIYKVKNDLIEYIAGVTNIYGLAHIYYIEDNYAYYRTFEMGSNDVCILDLNKLENIYLIDYGMNIQNIWVKLSYNVFLGHGIDNILRIIRINGASMSVSKLSSSIESNSSNSISKSSNSSDSVSKSSLSSSSDSNSSSSKSSSSKSSSSKSSSSQSASSVDSSEYLVGEFCRSELKGENVDIQYHDGMIYVANNYYGPLTFKLKGTDLVNIPNTFDSTPISQGKGAGDVRATWTEGFYLYVTDYLFGLKVYNPHTLTLLDQSALPQASCIWGKQYNSLVFVGTDNGTLATYYFNGIELTRKDIVYPPGAQVLNIVGYGTLDNLFIYVTTGMFLCCYKYDNITEKLDLVRQEATTAVDAWAEEEFVYVAGENSGLKAFDRLMLNRESTTPATEGTEFPTIVKHCAANNLGAIHGGRVGKFIRDQENKIRRNKLIVGAYGVITKAFIWRKLKKKDTVCICEAGSLSAIPAKDWRKLKRLLISWVAEIVGGVVIGWALKAILANQDGDMESYDVEDISMSSFSSLSSSNSSNSSERSWSSASSNSIVSNSSLSSNSSISFESFSDISNSSASLSSTNVTKPDVIEIDDEDDSDDMNDFVISGDKIYEVVNAITKVELYVIDKNVKTLIDDDVVEGDIISLIQDRNNYVVLSGNGILIVYGIQNDKLVRLSETDVGPSNIIVINNKGIAVIINNNGNVKIISINELGIVTIIRTDIDNIYINAIIDGDIIILTTDDNSIKIIVINPDNTLADIANINDVNYIYAAIKGYLIVLITVDGNVKIIKLNPEDNTLLDIITIDDENKYVYAIIEGNIIVLLTDTGKIKVIVVNLEDNTASDLGIVDDENIYTEIIIKDNVVIAYTSDDKIVFFTVIDLVLTKVFEYKIENGILAKAMDDEYIYILDELGFVYIFSYAYDFIALRFKEEYRATNLYINKFGLFMEYDNGLIIRYRFNGVILIELFYQMLIATDEGVILYDYRTDPPTVLDMKEIGFTISVVWYNGFWIALNSEGWVFVFDVIDGKLVETDKILIKGARQLAIDEDGYLFATTNEGIQVLKINNKGKIKREYIIETPDGIDILDSVKFKDMIVILSSDGKALIYKDKGDFEWELLTTTELGYLPIGLATDGAYIYILDGYGTVYIYTLSDEGILTLLTSKGGYEGAISINSNSQGIFLSFGKDGIKYFIFNGEDLIDVLDFDNGFYGNVVVIGDFVFYATDMGVMIYLTDEMGYMNYIDLIRYLHGVEYIWTDSTYLYVKDNDGNFDIYGNVGGVWTLLKRMPFGSDWTAINAENNKLYIAKGSTVYIYYFNGSELILIDSFSVEEDVVITDIKVDGDTLTLNVIKDGNSCLIVYKNINGIWTYQAILDNGDNTITNTYINGKYVFVVADGGGAIYVYEIIDGQLVLIQIIYLPNGKFICMVAEGNNVFISTDWGCFIYSWIDGQLVLIGFREGYIYRGMVIKNGVIYGGKGYGGADSWIWFNFEELSKNLIFNAKTTNN